MKNPKISLEEFIFENQSYKGKIARQNNQYLIENLSECKEIHDIINNPEKTKEILFQKLQRISHIYRESHRLPKNYPYSEKPEEVRGLSSEQLIIIFLLMKNLERKEFIEDIGILMEKNLQKPYTEDGGLIIFDDYKNLTPYPVESVRNIIFKKEDNMYFLMPIDALKKPHVLQYHFHAITDDCTKYAGPSKGNILEGGDMALCSWNITLQGESHNAVITKLKRKAFNIDYYGGLTIRNKKTMTVLDLGNYRYQN